MAIALGRFSLISPVAKGGMGVVWRGIEPTHQLPVAIKVISSEKADDEEYVEAFEREARAVAKLDHPNIILVHEYGVVDPDAAAASGGQLRAGTPYLVMEYASSTLKAQAPTLDWPHLRHLIKALLDALAHAHARGVIHRDIKPSNLLIATSRDQRPGIKLSDFGIAHALGDQGGDRAGTPPYMAPEQIVGTWRDLGPWTDLYALGCVIWRLCTGHTPFYGYKGHELFKAHLRISPPAFKARFPVPQDFELWLRRLLAKKPEKRFSRANQARELLALMVPEAKKVKATTLIPEPEFDEFPDASTVRAVSMGKRQQIPPDWRPPGVPPTRTGPRLGGLGLFGLRVVPLVGRETERDRIWSTLIESRNKRRLTLLAITGPAGSGRTRLLDWTAERGHEIGGFDTLRVHCSEEGDPLGRALDHLLGLSGLSRELIQKRLSKLLARVDERVRPGVLDVLAHIQVAEDSLTSLRALALEALAQDKRLVITLDDLDSSPDVQAFLEFMRQRQEVRPAPIAVVVTAKPGFEIPGISTTSLAEFSPEEQAEMLVQTLSLSKELAGQVGEHTQGNAGHMLQIVGQWVLDDHLLPARDGYVLAPGAPSAATSRDAAWKKRVQRIVGGLPEHALELLEIAAVLGVHVDESLWQRVSDDPDGTYASAGTVPFSPRRARTRTELTKRLFNEDLARETDDGWAFQQLGFRQAVLETARRSDRLQAHHRACAIGLSSSFSDDRTGSAIGDHLMSAGSPDEAVDLLLNAIRPTIERDGPTRALQVLERGERALDAAGSPASDDRRFRIDVERARLLQLTGNGQAAATLAASARSACEDRGLQALAAQASLVMARCRLQQLRWLTAERAATKGLDLVGDTQPALRVSLLMALSEARRQLPGRDSQIPLLKARGLTAHLSAHDRRSTTLDLDTRLGLLRRDWSHAASAAQLALSAARESHDLPTQHRSLAALGQAWRHLDRHEGALASLEEALEISRLLGDAAWPKRLSTLLMCLYRSQGPAAASKRLNKEASTMRRLHDAPLLVPLYITAAAIATWESKLEVAEHHLGYVDQYGAAIEGTEDHWVALSETAIRLQEANRPSAAIAWRLAKNVAEFARHPEWLKTSRAAMSALQKR